MPLERSIAKASRGRSDAEDNEGSHFFPHIPWRACKRLELWRMLPPVDGKPPRFTGSLVPVGRWDDEYAICLKAGGSGDGEWQVRCRGLEGKVLDAVQFPWDGDPIIHQANGQQTANETQLGILTLPGVSDPMVNVMFALLQQFMAQTRLDAQHQVTTIKEMFIAVCGANTALAASGNMGNSNEAHSALLKLLMSDSETHRARVIRLVEQNADLKNGKKTSTKEVVAGILEGMMTHGPALLEAIKGIGDPAHVAKLAAGEAAAAATTQNAPVTAAVNAVAAATAGAAT